MKRASGQFLGYLKRIKTKGHRTRWTNSRGQVFEEDTQHGELEKYNDRGRHEGSVDPDTDELIKEAVRGRRTEA